MGCLKHPQSGVWRRRLYGQVEEVDTCAVCGRPLDPLSTNKILEIPVMRRTILGWQRHVHSVARSKGWHRDEPDIWKFLGNLMAESAEAWEEARKPDFEPLRTYYSKDGKPEGLSTELADIVIRVMDTAEAFGIDLEAAIHEKSSYNETRPMRHGGKRA